MFIPNKLIQPYSDYTFKVSFNNYFNKEVIVSITITTSSNMN